ncbi:MAG: rod shape-determining protein MreD [Phascolarctobacterium sp.]|nr:rod shape-determining protein MreD [Phascolarctobacterium sp.]
MRRLIWPVLFLFLFILQGAVSVFYTGWLSLDLLLVGVYAHALHRGPEFGALSGLGAGFLQDAMLPGVFGYHMLTRTLSGFCFGHLKGKIFKENFIYHVPTIGLLSLALRFLYFGIALVIGVPITSLLTYLKESLGFACGNMLIVIPMVLLVSFICEWIKKEDISY